MNNQEKARELCSMISATSDRGVRRRLNRQLKRLNREIQQEQQTLLSLWGLK